MSTLIEITEDYSLPLKEVGEILRIKPHDSFRIGFSAVTRVTNTIFRTEFYIGGDRPLIDEGPSLMARMESSHIWDGYLE